MKQRSQTDVLGRNLITMRAILLGTCLAGVPLSHAAPVFEISDSDGIRSEPVAETGTTDLVAAEPAGRVDIFIGGLGDKESGPITDYKDALPSRPGRTVAYFRQNQVKEAIAFANASLQDGATFNIIAHSWGADAAVRVAKGVDGRVANLVGIDPVGKPLKKLIGKRGSRPENVENVVTVYGQPSQKDGSDTGETFGKLVGGQPRAFKKQADTTIRVDTHHTAFKDMLEAKGPDGLSAKDILDQSHDAKRD